MAEGAFWQVLRDFNLMELSLVPHCLDSCPAAICCLPRNKNVQQKMRYLIGQAGQTGRGGLADVVCR